MRFFENIFLIPGFVNCYLIERDEYCILIDAGMSKKAKKIIQKIQQRVDQEYEALVQKAALAEAKEESTKEADK